MDAWTAMVSTLNGIKTPTQLPAVTGRIHRLPNPDGDFLAKAWDHYESTIMNDDTTPLTHLQLEGRKVFESTLRGAQRAMAQGIPPAAVLSGLLAVVTEIGAATCGPRETRRMLMAVADCATDTEG